nr:class I SAM-dependent methyltransferase [Rhizobium sp. Q54]
MAGDRQKILESVAGYYSAKLAEHGQSARGVDWNGEASQTLRFEQLSKIIREAKGLSVNDLGCGYGSYFDYLRARFADARYHGFDLSSDMIKAAQRRFAGAEYASFVVAGEPDTIADYGIASGIFNVRLDSPDDVWLEYILQTLDVLDRTSRLGFAFNCLTSYSDPPMMRDYLYYANPGDLFDHCRRKYSRNVVLLHDYDLYEFTILVRKS